MKTRQNAGFSLVCCLLLVLLLCVGVTGFVSSTTLHRSTARFSLAKAVARSAAESAAAQASSLLAEKLAAYPDSVTSWQIIRPPNAQNWDFEGSVLHIQPKPGKSDPDPHVLPLISRPDSNGDLLEDLPASKKNLCLGSDTWTPENCVNLNRPLFRGDSQGWIGSPPDSIQKPHPFRARWIRLRPPSGSPPNPVTARYAFWMEDESFRIPVNLIQRTSSLVQQGSERGPESNSPGRGPEEIPIHGLVEGLRNLQPFDRKELALQAFSLRNSFPVGLLPEIRALNYIESRRKAVGLGDELRFLGTLFSSSLNLSRHGTQRVNLNAALGLEDDDCDWTQYPPPTPLLQKQHRRIVETIQFHSPQFGQRFYRTPPVTDLDRLSVPSNHREIYIHKLAANIRDMIDPDLQPTLVDSSGNIVQQETPKTPINADISNTTWAQGKDSAPCLQEAVTRFRSEANSSRYKLQIDYYLEFWNLSDQDVYSAIQPGRNDPHSIGPNSFVRISNQPGWISTPSGTPLKNSLPEGKPPTQNPARDLVIDLCNGVYRQGQPAPEGVLFRAGQCTVVTTDPDYLTRPEEKKFSPGFSGGYNLENIYFCSNLLEGTREYEGPLGPRGTAGIKPDFRDNTEDYDTEVLLGNPRGILDSHPAAIAMSGGARVTRPGQKRADWYGGTLMGNGITPSQLGDPRSNNEALRYTRFIPGASTSQPDQGRYFNTVTAPRFSLGHPNDIHTNPHLQYPWPDHYKGWNRSTNGAATPPRFAPTHIPNGKIQANGEFSPGIASIGLLGDVYDPARSLGTRGTLGIEGARGGGRSLRIGQPDDLVHGTQWTAPSREWAAWRLVDFFATRSEIQRPGLININGIQRDQGYALRAICHGLQLNLAAQAPRALQPVSGFRALATQLPILNSNPGVHQIIRNTLDLFSNRGPYTGCFQERGEWSELESFAAETETLFQGTRSSILFDHCREELFRRTIELLTTRGNIFTVYSLGQAVLEPKPPATSQQILAEHWLKTTFALLPMKSDGTPFGFPTETFDPDSPTSLSERFTAPDYYDIRILARSEL